MNQPISELILASASPRRSELLNQIAVPHRIHPVDIDETPREGESVTDLVKRLAAEKAWQGAAETGGDLPVLGSDTVGLLNGKVLLKPVDFVDAERMLMEMSGNWHEIHTSVAVVYQQCCFQQTCISRVKFRTLDPAEIVAYWQTGEPQDKAGAYAIQGRAAIFIEQIQGSYSGIMGLPLFETAQLLERAGLSCLGDNSGLEKPSITE